MKEDNVKSFKTFLGTHPEEYGTLCYTVGPAGWRDGVESTLRISDCDRQICLDFSFMTKERAEERIKKLDTMINALLELKSHIEYYKEDIPKKDKEYDDD